MYQISNYIKIYAFNCKLRIHMGIQYKADFLVGMFITLLNALLGPLVQYLIYTNTKGFPGWTLQQLMFFQGIVLIFLGLKNILFGDVRAVIMQIAWKGDFDRFLLKPYSALLNILANSFSVSGITTFSVGIAVTCWWYAGSQISFNGISFVLALICIIFALILYSVFIIFLCGIIIIFIQIGRMWDLLEVFLKFANYPLNIYPQFMENIFLILLPIGIIAYIPTNILLGKINYYIIISFFSIIILLFSSIKFWKHCIKKYTSAGG